MMRNLIIIFYMFFANITLAQHDPIKKILQEHFKKTEKIKIWSKNNHISERGEGRL